MNAIIAAAIANKRMVLTTLFLIFVGGLVSYCSIVKEDNPDIPIPFFVVDISHDGISPEDAERLLIKPMEVHMRQLEGLKEMNSTGREGGASIVLEFHPTVDNEEAKLDVREAVDKGKSDLPDDTDEPNLSEFNAARFPIIQLVLYGNVPERTLARLSRQLRDDLEAIPDVLEADVSGVREDVLEIIVDPNRLMSYNVAPGELLDIINRNNQLVAAGSLDSGTGRFAVKVPGLVETPEDLLSLPIKTSPNGVVTLRDITSVRRTFKDPTSLSRFNGQPAVTIEVSKRAGANVVETAEAVKTLTRASQDRWPGDVQVEFLGDQSVFVSDFLDTLRNSVLSAIVLVAVVVVAVLGLRPAGLVGVSIPGSFLFGIMMLYLAGFSINTVVMFGLILSVGLLVDGAIVVTEYADRKMLEGLPREQAYLMAAKRMSWPIIASTLTTLAAFMPLLFWPDVTGEFMKFLPLTLIFTLAGSLLMALIFLPTLGSLIGRPGEANANVMSSLAADHEFDVMNYKGFTGWYARLLARAIRHPIKISLFAFAGLIGVWVTYVSQEHGTLFFPEGEPNLVRLLVHARGNLSIYDMDRLVRDVEEIAVGVEGVAGVENVSTRTGTVSGFDSAPDIIGRITLLLDDWQVRPPAVEIERELRARTASVPGVLVELEREQQGPVQGKDIQVRVASEIPELIEPVAAAIYDHMDQQMVGLIELDDSRDLPGIQWDLAVDRAEAGRYGTDVVTIGSFVQLVTNGTLADRYRPDDAEDEVDIRVRFPLDDRGLTALDTLMIQTANGAVPISNFVDRVATPKVGQVQRIDGERVIRVNANVADGYLTNDKVVELKGWIAEQGFNPLVHISFTGADEAQQESSAFLIKAFAASLFIMAIILITQFNSFYHAALVLTAVVLSTVGVVFGLIVTERPFVVVMSGVGIIALAGIVVNNNIVLIDTYARLIKQGIEPYEAIVRTGAQRLRPVMLTTTTTIIGLLPMVFQFNMDFWTRQIVIGSPTSFIWVDLALAVVFGLSFATVLTLVITPSLLALRVQLGNSWRTRRDRWAKRRMAADTALPAPVSVKQAAE